MRGESRVLPNAAVACARSRSWALAFRLRRPSQFYSGSAYRRSSTHGKVDDRWFLGTHRMAETIEQQPRKLPWIVSSWLGVFSAALTLASLTGGFIKLGKLVLWLLDEWTKLLHEIVSSMLFFLPEPHIIDSSIIALIIILSFNVILSPKSNRNINYLDEIDDLHKNMHIISDHRIKRNMYITGILITATILSISILIVSSSSVAKNTPFPDDEVVAAAVAENSTNGDYLFFVLNIYETGDYCAIVHPDTSSCDQNLRLFFPDDTATLVSYYMHYEEATGGLFNRLMFVALYDMRDVPGYLRFYAVFRLVLFGSILVIAIPAIVFRLLRSTHLEPSPKAMFSRLWLIIFIAAGFLALGHGTWYLEQEYPELFKRLA